MLRLHATRGGGCRPAMPPRMNGMGATGGPSTTQQPQGANVFPPPNQHGQGDGRQANGGTQRPNETNFARKPYQRTPATDRSNRDAENKPANETFGDEKSNKGPAPADDKFAYVPRSRTIDDIYAEDVTRSSAFASNLYESDAEVKVLGGGENIVVIDEWSDAGFPTEILENIRLSQYIRPRVFQKYVMPYIMEGKDIKGQAETGSGKSAAFLLPIINNLMKKFAGTNRYERRSKIAALIIEPTRELAKQLYEQACKFARGTGVSVNYTYGGYTYSQNMSNIHLTGCDIFVGTPARLAHMITKGDVKISDLEYFVLDEADCLLEYNFMDDIERIYKMENFPPPDKRQTMFFSATFSKEVLEMANVHCRKECVLVKNENKVNKRVHQEIVEVPVNQRNEYLLNYLKQQTAQNNNVTPKHLIFVETKRQADLVASMLATSGIRAMTVNGDRPQQWRDETTAQFCAGNLRVVVATSVMARGLDILDLGIVVNMYLPVNHHVYIHRVGRTGRVSDGRAIAYFDPEFPADRQIAEALISELNSAGVPVPDFVSRAREPLITFGAGLSGACDGFENLPGSGGNIAAMFSEPPGPSKVSAFAELPQKNENSETVSPKIASNDLPKPPPEFSTDNTVAASFANQPSANSAPVNCFEQLPQQDNAPKFPTSSDAAFANPPSADNVNNFAKSGPLPQQNTAPQFPSNGTANRPFANLPSTNNMSNFTKSGPLPQQNTAPQFPSNGTANRPFANLPSTNNMSNFAKSGPLPQQNTAPQFPSNGTANRPFANVDNFSRNGQFPQKNAAPQFSTQRTTNGSFANLPSANNGPVNNFEQLPQKNNAPPKKIDDSSDEEELASVPFGQLNSSNYRR